MVTVKQAYDKIRTSAYRIMGLDSCPFCYKNGKEACEEFDALIELGTSKYMAYVWVGDKTDDALKYAIKLMKRKYRVNHPEEE